MSSPGNPKAEEISESLTYEYPHAEYSI